jgi:hypothetical protein
MPCIVMLWCRSAVLAECVFDGVRAKMSHLRAQLADREASLVMLQQVCMLGRSMCSASKQCSIRAAG